MWQALASWSSTTKSSRHTSASQAGGSGRFLRSQIRKSLPFLATLFPHSSNHCSHSRYSLSHFESSSDLCSSDGPGTCACSWARTGAALAATADTTTSIAIASFMTPPSPLKLPIHPLSVALIQKPDGRSDASAVSRSESTADYTASWAGRRTVESPTTEPLS